MNKEKKRKVRGKNSSLLSMLLSAVLLLSAVFFQGCALRDEGYTSDRFQAATEVGDDRIGIIYVGDELDGWTAAHMTGVRTAINELNIPDDKVIELFNVKEDESAYRACITLINQGCKLIFATSYSFEDYIIQAAREHPEVEFCHCSGMKALTENLPNYHNYFDRICEARYVSGVAAGMKLSAMLKSGQVRSPKLGYVGAFPYAEVISGFTAFFLGVRSIVPEATMEVRYSGSWTDVESDYRTAGELIEDGCVLLSQHSDTAGVAYMCQDSRVPFVGFNIDMTSIAPDTAITSPTNDWSRYYMYAMKQFENNLPIITDWTGGYAEGIIGTTGFGRAAVPGTTEAMNTAVKNITSGKLHVFDCSTFTINGKHPTENDRDEEGKQIFEGGYYHEGEERSAPSFDMIIDGITES